jgi:formate hydrogenlyase subunit 3/multisubunit Na+/H+ antiporter MnhD subunit
MTSRVFGWPLVLGSFGLIFGLIIGILGLVLIFLSADRPDHTGSTKRCDPSANASYFQYSTAGPIDNRAVRLV